VELHVFNHSRAQEPWQIEGGCIRHGACLPIFCRANAKTHVEPMARLRLSFSSASARGTTARLITPRGRHGSKLRFLYWFKFLRPFGIRSAHQAIADRGDLSVGHAGPRHGRTTHG
jgi:hypothetical protein